MMAFGKKKVTGGAAGAAPQPPAAADAPRERRRKPHEMLASVVKESAIPAAIDVLKGNEKFALPDGRSWVCLGLQVSEIGGLSKKQSGDEVKGSLIQLITSDQLEVVVTRELLQDETLGLIPTPNTLERMAEYSVLLHREDKQDGERTPTPYVWLVLESRDSGSSLKITPVGPTTHKQALDVSKGQLELSVALGEKVWAWAEQAASDEPNVGVEIAAASEAPVQDEIAVDPDDPFSDESEQPFPEDETMPVDDDTAGWDPADEPGEPELYATQEMEAIPQEDSEDVVHDDAEEAYDPNEEDFSDDGPVDPYDEQAEWTIGDGDDEDAPPVEDDTYAQYLVETQDREVTEEQVRTGLVRRFLNDELGLEIDIADFEAIFYTDAPALSFDTGSAPSDWLGDQLAHIKGQANAELAAIHANNVAELRQSYVDTMGLHVEAVHRAVSTGEDGTVYRDLMRSAQTEFDTASQRIGEQASAERAEMTARFEAEVRSRGEQAAAQAASAFRDRKGPLLDKSMAEVGLSLERRAEERLAHSKGSILELRRREAQTRMDLGTTRALSLLSERAAIQRSELMDRVTAWNNEMMAVIDEHRKDDVARSQALSEELARGNEVETQRAANEQRIQEIRAEHASRVEDLQTRLSQERNEALGELETREEKWNHDRALRDEELRHERELNAALTQQMAGLDSTYKEQYDQRLSAAIEERDSYLGQIKVSNEIQARANRMLLLLVVLVAFAFLAVGFILGFFLMGNDTPNAVGAILSLPLDM